MRAWQRDERGFSTVVGAIVLIAIVIALAATSWFLVSRVRDETHLDKQRPDLALQVDAIDPAVRIVRASDDLDYARDLRFTGDCSPLLNGGPMPPAEGQLVHPDDRITCDWGESLVISSSAEKGNVVLFSHTF
jgi:flagellin-like protein